MNQINSVKAALAGSALLTGIVAFWYLYFQHLVNQIPAGAVI